ncbi:SpoIID/LytB domain-containing protein [Rhodococcus spelaei]|uniref:SpoIID/LytB domain-containing protein n=1 Tax=Rhodococcus spelaei TaxID=2546320 RepID=A0A541BR49_9NOCA|nr:SpoIID/LytB domain-containing protein [Rhodococcus spelaei]TQF74800.1 SpoIID/LytB domain-containing protein [Rhodococcus spelaei]
MAKFRRKNSILGTAVRGRGRPLSARAVALAVVPALAVGGAVGLVLVEGPAAPAVAPVVAADAPFTLVGHGHGHGRGMGQWGAYGYARGQGWSAERIVGHYYGGTTLETQADKRIGVRLIGLDGKDLAVHSDAGARVAGQEVAPGDAVHLTATPGGGANVVITKGCDGAVVWQGATDHPWVDPIDLDADRPANEHLKLCGGNAFRGSMGVALEGTVPRVVNFVDMEDYLLGVVPAESKAEWADTGGKEALRAQAIAARSYASAEKRYGYAETCDTQDCQVYDGSGKEDPRTTEAVRTTAGKVLVSGGQPVSAEFSSSTGGYTAGGVFSAVEDLGDALSPTHDWTQTLTAGDIAKAFGVGELHSVKVTSRNNLGADGGRVTGLEVVGSTGTVQATGNDARVKLGIKSDWFTIAEGLGAPAPVAPPAAPPAPGATPDPNPAPAPVPPSEIEKKYAEFGGPAGVLGGPLGPEMSMPDEAGRFRMFEHGAIVWTDATGAQVIDASVLKSTLPGTGSAG